MSFKGLQQQVMNTWVSIKFNRQIYHSEYLKIIN